jgi:endonuclease YncB( thermonuclease family)
MADLVAHATIDHVYDGDTPICSFIALGLGVGLVSARVRVNGINAPENSTTEGQAATAFAKTLAAPGDTVTLISPGPLGRRDNYGRVLASVTLADGRDWAEEMVAAGHAGTYTVHALEVGQA